MWSKPLQRASSPPEGHAGWFMGQAGLNKVHCAAPGLTVMTHHMCVSAMKGGGSHLDQCVSATFDLTCHKV